MKKRLLAVLLACCMAAGMANAVIWITLCLHGIAPNCMHR